MGFHCDNLVAGLNMICRPALITAFHCELVTRSERIEDESIPKINEPTPSKISMKSATAGASMVM
jgi:hypothetical protein